MINASIDSVAPGTTLRVVALDNVTSYAITIDTGTATLEVDQGEGTELIFFDDGGTGKWLVTHLASAGVLA